MLGQALVAHTIMASRVQFNSVVFDTPGTYTWVVPDGVTSVSVVAIGGGGGGASYETSCYDNGDDFVQDLGRATGGGGGLGFINNYAVSPGDSYTVVVGSGGQGAHFSPDPGTYGDIGESGAGGDSYFNDASTVLGGGGGEADLDRGNGASINSHAGSGGTHVGDGGSDGDAGNFAEALEIECAGGWGINNSLFKGGDAGGYFGSAPGPGINDATRGESRSAYGPDGGIVTGGGGGGTRSTNLTYAGRDGVVRIMWPGDLRAFPDDKVEQIFEWSQ